jgi:hypothetical protein
MKTLEKTRVGLVNNRINWKLKENITCANMAQWGFSARAIGDYTGLNETQVYNRLNRLGIKIKDYRDAKNDNAKTIIVKLKVRLIENDRR